MIYGYFYAHDFEIHQRRVRKILRKYVDSTWHSSTSPNIVKLLRQIKYGVGEFGR